jgi:hypothetical protein
MRRRNYSHMNNNNPNAKNWRISPQNGDQNVKIASEIFRVQTSIDIIGLAAQVASLSI